LNISISITIADVLNISSIDTYLPNGAHQLLIDGDGLDSVRSVNQGWQASGQIEVNGTQYSAYFSADATAELLIAVGVQTQIT
jgi:hypothetical protein